MIILEKSYQYTERIAARQLEILIIYEETSDLNLAEVLENEILLGAFLGTDYQKYYEEKYLSSLEKYIRSKL